MTIKNIELNFKSNIKTEIKEIKKQKNILMIGNVKVLSLKI